jgi:hypothetical protein
MIQKAKDKWLDQLISGCNGLDSDPYKAWVATKPLSTQTEAHVLSIDLVKAFDSVI